MTAAHLAVWAVFAASIFGVLTRPRGIPEWVWALSGAALLCALGLVPAHDAIRAVGRGTDVYLFLAGMMVLAELARRAGVFDWAASHAVRAARGSPLRLFALVYGVGIIVTVLLSNDATAVVLTPAVAAAAGAAGAEPLPFLFACAFVANAASFVLPISNPANLVVFARAMPVLPRWLATFSVPSLLAIACTFVVLGIVSRRSLRGNIRSDVAVASLSGEGRLAVAGIAVTAVALVITSALGAALGWVTFLCAAGVFAVACVADRDAFSEVVRSVSWTVLLLVAGLFVLVESLEHTGLLEQARHGFALMESWPPALSVLGAAAVSAAASNLLNNLPSGLIAGSSIASLQGHDAFRCAVAIGIDLGPNLSVTGSLATVLWLIALRREKVHVDAWTFLRTGALVMPPALILAALGLLLTSRN